MAVLQQPGSITTLIKVKSHIFKCIDTGYFLNKNVKYLQNK